MTDRAHGADSIATWVPALMYGLLAAYIVPYVVTAFIDGYGLAAGTAGALAMADIGAIALVSVALALKRRSVEPGTLFVVGVLSCSAGNVMTALIDAPAWLAAARALSGAGAGCVLAVANLGISAGQEPERRYGRANAAMSCLFALMLWAMSYLDLGSHPSWLFLGVASAGLLLLPLTPRGTSGARATAQTAGSVLGAHAPAAALFATIMTANLALGGTYAFTDRIGIALALEPGVYATLLSGSTIGGIAGGLLAAWLGRRRGWRVPLAGGIVIASSSLWAIVGAHSVPMFAAGLLVYGALFIFLTAYLLGAAAVFDPTGRLVIAVNGAALFMYAVGPFAFGVMVDRLSLPQLGALMAGICALALVPLGAVLRALERPAAAAVAHHGERK